MSSLNDQLEWLVTYTFTTPVPVAEHGTTAFESGETTTAPTGTTCTAKSETVIADPTTGQGLLAFLTDGASSNG
ncbi:MAG TPA: hypothetical protein VHW47_00360 [Acidimicrobiales bacterium]|jgi:hypothetical protein|nr:hypothetical protein [Acidimicrobiales bacterium]